MLCLEEVLEDLRGTNVVINGEVIENFQWSVENNIYNLGTIQFVENEYIFIEEHLGDYIVVLKDRQIIIEVL